MFQSLHPGIILQLKALRITSTLQVHLKHKNVTLNLPPMQHSASHTGNISEKYHIEPIRSVLLSLGTECWKGRVNGYTLCTTYTWKLDMITGSLLRPLR